MGAKAITASNKGDLQIAKWILGEKLSRKLFIAGGLQVVISGLDVLFLGLISPLVLSLGTQKDSSALEVLGLFKVSTPMIFGLILFTVISKNFGAFFLQAKILRDLSRREAEVGTALVKASLFEKTDVVKSSHSSELLQTFVSVISSLFSNIFRPTMAFIGDISTMIAVLLGLLIINPQVAVITITYFSICGWVIMRYVGNRQEVLGSKTLSEGKKALRTFTEIRLMNKELRLAHREDYFLDNMNAERRTLTLLQARSNLINVMPRYVLELILIVGIGGLIPFLLHVQKHVSILPTLALLIAAGYRVLPSLNLVIITLGNFKNGLPLLKRIYDLSVRFEIEDSPLEFKKDFLLDHLSEYRGDLVFEGINFRYFNGEKDIFTDLNFKIPAKQTILITGPSGSGKTTLIGLAAGTLTPNQGRIYLKDEDRETPMDTSISGIAYLSQDVPLLDESFTYNITILDPSDPSAARLERSAKDAGIYEKIAQSPLGFDTQIGENGSSLSAGERQRLGIARSLYLNPQFLIMDEPTANLDPKAEEIVWETIRKLKGTLSILLVSHRLVPEAVYDSVLILGNETGDE